MIANNADAVCINRDVSTRLSVGSPFISFFLLKVLECFESLYREERESESESGRVYRLAHDLILSGVPSV